MRPYFPTQNMHIGSIPGTLRPTSQKKAVSMALTSAGPTHTFSLYFDPMTSLRKTKSH